ncbi:sugar ABC transporter ATP-binding protein [Actinomadura sp. B10D3]|uniref:sugar ABC transporter ATP-binding protein n=1 Tax=Actinomadura sp. B10D3 TaxID=3153557 RepID=UPI00325D1B81
MTTTVSGSTAALTLRGLRRHYAATKALDWTPDSILEIKKGEVHGLLGENGAGKSTLLGVIAGLTSPDGGSMELLGRPYAPGSVVEARRRGVEIVLQEPGLVPSLTVAENFLLGRGSVASRAGVLLPGRTLRSVGDALQRIAPHVSPRVRADSLSLEDRKLVELARAVHFKPAVLLIDEMSACLGHDRLGLLFDAMRGLTDAGVAIVYISHYLEEVHEVCHTVSVLKDGRLMRTLPGDSDPDTLTRLMVGRPTGALYRADTEARTGGEEVLKVTGLTLQDAYEDIDLTVREGEILGIGGLVGCGAGHLARTLFGDLRADSGTVTLGGRPYAPAGPRQAIRLGVAYVPPDRDREGVLLRSSLSQNITLPTLRQRSLAGGLYGGRADAGITERMIKDLGIRCRGGADLPANLSGGNRQKVVLSKWLVDPPKLLILHNPTRGIDVGAKAEIYALMQRLARAGTAILLITDELPELLGMSDRIVMLRRGAVSYRTVRDARPTEETLVSRMI